MRVVCMVSGAVNPGGTCINARKVRIISPEQINKTSANATCKITRALRARCRSRLWLSARPPSRRPVFTRPPAYLRIGMEPIRRLVKSASANVKSKTGKSMPISWMRGRPVGAEATRICRASSANSQSKKAAQHAQNDAFKQQVRRDSPRSRAQCCAHGQFLTAAFHAHQQQIRDVGASHQQNDGDGSHQHPQNAAYIADHVLLQRPEVRGKVRIMKQIDTKARRRGKASQGDGNQPCHVRAGLRHGDSRLQPGECLVTEVPEIQLAAIPLEGHEERGIFVVEKTKSFGQHADDFTRLSVHCDGAPDARIEAAPNFCRQYP